MRKARMILAAAALALCWCLGNAQTLSSHIDKVPGSYNFWLSTPRKGQGAALKPLVVFLHGASLSGRDLNRVLRYGTLDAIKRGLKLDAYVLAPQTPGSGWNPAKVMQAVDYVIENHEDIDTTRIYVVGMSLGGYGTIDVANAYPQRVAAALAFCGGSTASDFTGLAQVPIWIVHGMADRAVGIGMSDRVAAALEEIDPDTPRLIYDRVPGMDHGGPARYFYMPEFYQWLFQHSTSDPDRPMAYGFEVTDEMVRGVYRRLQKGTALITVPDAQGEPEADGLLFIPAGFEDDYMPELPAWMQSRPQ